MNGSHREAKYQVAVTVAALVGVLCGLFGCMPTREEVYGEIDRIHRGTYRRWREGRAQKDELPRVGGDLSLTQAIELAVVKAYNPGLREIIEERAKGQGRIFEAYSEALPQLDAAAGYTITESPPGLGHGMLSTYSGSLTVTQPLYKGGVVGAGLRGARLFSYMADERVREEVESVVHDVASKYWDYRLAKELFEVQKAALESAERQLKDVEAKLEQGFATEFDRLRARVEVANFRTATIQQRNRISLSRARLYRAMGISQRSEAEPTEPLDYRPLEISYEEAVEIASLNRPDLYQAELDRRLQDEVLKVVRSGYLPKVEAFFSNLWSQPHPRTGKSRWGDLWTAGVSLNWPVFDGLRTRGRMIQQRAQIRQREIRLEDTIQRLLLEVHEALLDLADSQELVETQRLNQERAELALELAEIGNEAGVRTDLEVIDTRAALVLAKGLYYQALYDHTMARLDLQRAMGLLTPPKAAEEAPAPGRPKWLPASLGPSGGLPVP